MSTNKTQSTSNNNHQTKAIFHSSNSSAPHKPNTAQSQSAHTLHPLHPSHLPQLQSQSAHPKSTQSHSTTIVSHQTLKSSLPPRYQPPPQPTSSILKRNLSPTKSSIPTFTHHSNDTNAAAVAGPSAQIPSGAHLSIKYPPEVPKLANVYIPESVRNNTTSSRIATVARSHPSGRLPSVNCTNQTQLPLPQVRTPQIDDEQNRQAQEMLKFVRKSDADSVGGASTSATSQASSSNSANSHPSTSNNIMRMTAAEQSRHFQSLVAELRALKEANQRLSDDNQELRDLCCFLDDDRQKGRKLAREWQRFGRYTASVMRQEVSAYQNKLRQLDDKQQELIRDNLELKELCLYLDEERANLAASIPSTCTSCGTTIRPTTQHSATGVMRDDGDGSSSSTNDEPMPAIRQFDRVQEQHIRSTLSDQTLQYVRSLERRVMEQESTATPTNITNGGGASIVSSNNNNSTNNNNNNNNNSSNNSNPSSSEILSGRPEAVVRALQILEVREQLERDRAGNSSLSPEQMDDGEKALLREMCNVVWRKLEENPNGPDVDPL